MSERDRTECRWARGIGAAALLAAALLCAAPSLRAQASDRSRHASGQPAFAETPCGAVPRSERAHLLGAVDSVGVTVSDAARTAEFLARVLDFEKVSDVEVTGADYERLEGVFGLRMRVVRMRLGEEYVDLHEYLAPRGRPVPADSRSNDGWFQHVAIVVRDIDLAYRRLREHDVEHASAGPQTLPAWNESAGGIRAFYFKDPDGHVLEVIEFPPDKGDRRWHTKARAAPNELFLGVDHTAIVVDDTDASLAFYRDVLGMRVVGESENWGEEQERLNNVFGARLRITTLRAARGPGVELLEYLAPRDGRPYPHDLRANDLAFWRTRLWAPDLERAGAAVRAARSPLLSPGAVELPDGRIGFRRGLTLRDPDGHALQIVSR